MSGNSEKARDDIRRYLDDDTQRGVMAFIQSGNSCAMVINIDGKEFNEQSVSAKLIDLIYMREASSHMYDEFEGMIRKIQELVEQEGTADMKQSFDDLLRTKTIELQEMLKNDKGKAEISLIPNN